MARSSLLPPQILTSNGGAKRRIETVAHPGAARSTGRRLAHLSFCPVWVQKSYELSRALEIVVVSVQNDELVSCLSGNTAIAARVGTHRVTYEPGFGVPNSSGLQLRIDGKVATTGVDFGDGGSVETSSDGIDIHFPDGKVLSVSGSLPLLSGILRPWGGEQERKGFRRWACGRRFHGQLVAQAPERKIGGGNALCIA